MENKCNATHPEAWAIHCVQFELRMLFWVISAMLVISLCVNIFCCVSKCCSGKRTCKPGTRRRGGPRQMEDNPIYGNISYLQSSIAVDIGDDPQQLSSLADQQRINSDSQSKTQDCYANLSLKAPRQQAGHTSSQIEYSDVVHLEEPPESEKEDEGNADAVSTLSDLYASVQNQRTKTVIAAEGGEGYVNHL